MRKMGAGFKKSRKALLRDSPRKAGAYKRGGIRMNKVLAVIVSAALVILNEIIKED